MPEDGSTDPTPDLTDLLQEEVEVLAVPVRGEGMFLTAELPAKRVQCATDIIPALSWTSLLPATPKRKRSVIISTDKPFYVSASGTGVAGMLWPANNALTVLHVERVYVMSADAALPATISHMTELWAD